MLVIALFILDLFPKPKSIQQWSLETLGACNGAAHEASQVKTSNACSSCTGHPLPVSQAKSIRAWKLWVHAIELHKRQVKSKHLIRYACYLH